MSSPKCYAPLPKRHQMHWSATIAIAVFSSFPCICLPPLGRRARMYFHVSCRHPMLPSMFFGVGVLGGCRQEIVSVFFACLLADEQYPSLNLSLTPLQQPAKYRSERRTGTTMSIPSDPSQTSSSSSAASGSKPTGRSLSEILQTAPTGAAHPGVEEIRNIDPKEDQERVIAFTKVSHSELCRFRSVGMPGARLPMALALALARAMALRAFARDKLRVLRGRLCASHYLASLCPLHRVRAANAACDEKG